MNNEMVARLNEQIALEFSSGYLYLGFAARLEALALPGAAHWYRVQAKEELKHGMRIFDHLIRAGAEVKLGGIAAPQNIPESFSEIAAAGLRHELYITESIEGIMYHAVDEEDYLTQHLMQWFIAEQLEEEENARGILDALGRITGCKAGLVMLDEKLGGRKE